QELGLQQIGNTESLEEIIQIVLQENPKEVERYRAGEVKLMGFFVGLVMKASKGQAHPAKTNELLKKLLASEA
nr:hypothetical protein [Bacteriovoracaceae bacterium]